MSICFLHIPNWETGQSTGPVRKTFVLLKYCALKGTILQQQLKRRKYFELHGRDISRNTDSVI